MFQDQIDKLYGASMTLHTQLGAIEHVKVTKDVVDAFSTGARVMEEQTKHLCVPKKKRTRNPVDKVRHGYARWHQVTADADIGLVAPILEQQKDKIPHRKYHQLK